MQSTIDAEFRNNALRIKKKMEDYLNEIEIQLRNNNNNNK